MSIETNTETPEAYYTRKILECSHECAVASSTGRKKFVRYFEREVENYRKLLTHRLEEIL